MPVFSIIIPAYNNSRYLPECVHSLTSQEFRDIEIIIVDDASTDDTYSTALTLAEQDARVVVLRHERNAGTLAARATGIEAACGNYILLIDQDDALVPRALSSLLAISDAYPADIYHYGVRVEASTVAAQQAAAGMASFLTPMPRHLYSHDILQAQFSDQGNFDWHVHHKMYRAALAKRAYAMATNERLLLSDDLYMCFILDSLAQSYYAIPESPWYIYHLGRGDTFGSKSTVQTLDRLAYWESEAFRHIQEFVHAHSRDIRRNDWDERIHDAGTRLIEHTMNEWKDTLSPNEQIDGLTCINRHWPPDMVCAEIYRYVRDHAYAYYTASDRQSEQAELNRNEAMRFFHMAQSIEKQHMRAIAKAHNRHYLQMKTIACQHLMDGGILRRQSRSKSATLAVSLRSLLSRFITH